MVAGTAPALIVGESTQFLAFLDHRPVFAGHCLVVPRGHADTLTDLPGDVVGPFFTFVQRITRAVESGLAADGTFVAMNNKVSQSVPHLHVHVVPRRKKDGLRGFFWPRQKYENDEDARRTRDLIRAALLE
jgi:histidine triad (HIT) family protein